METNMERSFKTLKIELLYYSSTSCIYPKECTPGYGRATRTPMFIAALFTITKLWK
jgi:hypothetical protein